MSEKTEKELKDYCKEIAKAGPIKSADDLKSAANPSTKLRTGGAK